MIVRVFRARTQPGKAGEFRRFFQEQALPLVRSQPGLVRVEVGWPMAPATDEFLMLTVWKDLESLKAFAGDRWQVARILEEERPLLKETRVDHYQAESDWQ